jgi:hypothetical protein
MLKGHCPADGYPLLYSNEANPARTQPGRCTNPTHPIASACPKCRSTRPHKRLTIGRPQTVECYSCHHFWTPDGQ